jgi:hypothetical protein
MYIILVGRHLRDRRDLLHSPSPKKASSANVDLSPNQSSLPTVEERKEMFKFSREDFLGAIRGEKAPHALGAGVIETSLVRGIRHQTSNLLTEQFAKELHGADPMYMRVVNA